MIYKYNNIIDIENKQRKIEEEIMKQNAKNL